jgi:NhaA family Na+:H+ antiporter
VSDPRPGIARLFSRSGWVETRVVADALRTETLGGTLLLAGAVIALLWANSPWQEGYQALRELRLGPSSLHLDLQLQHWASDGLLAIFFFVAGLELKRELIAGDLRDPRRAAVPVMAALGGIALPALIYVGLTWGDAEAMAGWAIPTATDIAFALAVLAVIGTHLPNALRAFLLTLAVVDDLVAIVIIAIFYSDSIHVVPLLAAIVPLAAFAVLVQRRRTGAWLLVPLAGLTWALVHASGVHATVAGVLLALVVPARARTGEQGSLAEHLEHRVRPLSAGVAVPVFAFFAAGVTLTGGGVGEALADRVVPATVLGLVVGKAVGVFTGAYLTARWTRARLADDLAWSDVLGVSLLAGVGFTVSLLIGELAFGVGSDRDDHVKMAVLTGSMLAAALATVVLRARNRVYRRIHEEETRDSDADSIPDVYDPNPLVRDPADDRTFPTPPGSPGDLPLGSWRSKGRTAGPGPGEERR